MESTDLIHSFLLIFTGAAVLATVALFSRQPLLVAYVAIGALLGPYGLGWVADPTLLADIADIGILFLLFLLGLDMQPSSLLHSLKNSTLVALLSAAVFALMGFGLGQAFDFNFIESAIIGACMMFSSTIIGIKLLPTTVLHHRRTGEIVVSLLLLQDLLAIITLLVIGDESHSGTLIDLGMWQWVWTLLSLPAHVIFSLMFVRYIILPLLQKFDVFHEYIFLLAIGWCLGCAEVAHGIGLSHEIGAFIAGVTIATSPISQYIANSLKPLRDFFLVLFFFSLGAVFNLGLLDNLLLPIVILSAMVLLVKPIVFRWLLQGVSESKPLAWEIGLRLGQNSEFSLLIAFVATSSGLIGQEASHLIQATALLTFLVSSYLVVFKYPTPIALNPRLRRD